MSNTIYSEKTIPYREMDEPCKDDNFHKGFRNSQETTETYTLQGYEKIEGSASALKKALDNGPVIATVRAGNSVFRHFSKGVIDSE